MHVVILVVAVVFCALFFSLITDVFVERKIHKGQEAQQEEIELKLTYAYQNPQWNEQILQTVAGFEEAYPNIHVVCDTDYEHQVYENVLAKRIARNELGDIVQLKTPDAYVKGGYLAEIPATLSDRVSYAYGQNGKTWAIGAVETTNGVLYNKKLFAQFGLQAPTSYQDFLRICEVLKENGITPIGIAGNDLWHMEYWVNHFFRTEVLSDNEQWLSDCRIGETAWTDDEIIRMLEDMKRLFENGYVNEDWRAAGDTSLAYMLQREEVAMIYTGPWTAAGMSEDERWEAGWFLVPDASGLTYAAQNQDVYWAVSKECGESEEKYEAAIAFLEYFYSESNYGRLCDSTLTYPVVKQSGVAPSSDSIRGEVLDVFLMSAERMQSYIGDADCPQYFEKDMLEIIMQYLVSDLSAEDAADRIQEAWNNRVEMEENE